MQVLSKRVRSLPIRYSAIRYSAQYTTLAIDPRKSFKCMSPKTLLRLIQGDLLSACPQRQFRTIPGLWNSRAALSNSYPNAYVPCTEAVCTIFDIGGLVFGITRPGHRFLGPVSQKYLTVVLSLTCSNLLKYVVICLVRLSNISLNQKAMYIIIIYFLSWAFLSDLSF